MNGGALRKELSAYIEVIPENRLELLRPLLAAFAEPEFAIETDLTDGEKAIITKGSKRYKEHPEEFVLLEDFLEQQGISL